MDGDVKDAVQGTATGQQTATDRQTKADTGADAASTQTKEETASSAGSQPAAAKIYDEDYIKELEAKHQAAMQTAVEEAAKKATMQPDEKAEYEKAKAAEQLAAREKAIAERELRADARGLLVKEDLPDTLLDYVIGKDLQDTTKRLHNFKQVFDAAVQTQVEKRMAGTTPTGGNGAEMSETDQIKAIVAANMY